MGSDTDRLKTGRRQSGSHIPRGLKQRIRKKFSQECLRLLTCLLMGDPKLLEFAKSLVMLASGRVHTHLFLFKEISSHSSGSSKIEGRLTRILCGSTMARQRTRLASSVSLTNFKTNSLTAIGPMLRGLNKIIPGCDPGGNLRRSAKSRSRVKTMRSSPLAAALTSTSTLPSSPSSKAVDTL